MTSYFVLEVEIYNTMNHEIAKKADFDPQSFMELQYLAINNVK